MVSSTGKIVKDQFQKGQNLITIETTDLASGVYLIYIEGESFIKTHKLIVN